MTLTRTRLNLSLFLIRLGCAAFLAVWASLKFLRPEWMGNVFRGTYKMTWLKKDVGLNIMGMEFGFLDIAYAVGALQMLIAFLFLIGLWRTLSYGLVTLIHATGVIGSLLSGGLVFKGGLIKAISTGTFAIGYINFPANLLWTSVATLTALVGLFLMRHHDGWTIDGWRKRR